MILGHFCLDGLNGAVTTHPEKAHLENLLYSKSGYNESEQATGVLEKILCP
jgi:hypothetical protein